MALFVCSLNSGSNGNCFYVGNDHEAVLVDAGLSARETEKRMTRAGLSMAKLRAIFITHEHSDHISGLESLSKKYQLPVFITDATHKESRVDVRPNLLKSFRANKAIPVGSLRVSGFKKFHDAVDPHSFIIECAGIRVGVITDIGHSCRQVTTHFEQCHAVFLESNYCPDRLMNGSYPYHLKKRIASDQGHLSNHQALDLFINHRASFLSHLFLSHLSQHNNDPSLVESLFEANAGHTRIVIASRYQETEVYKIDGVLGNAAYTPHSRQQLSLF